MFGVARVHAMHWVSVVFHSIRTKKSLKMKSHKTRKCLCSHNIYCGYFNLLSAISIGIRLCIPVANKKDVSKYVFQTPGMSRTVGVNAILSYRVNRSKGVKQVNYSWGTEIV